MQNSAAKNRYLSPVARFFTRADFPVYELIDFDSVDDFERPVSWSPDATRSFAAATQQNIPLRLKAIEENTVPSWLWSHAPAGTSLHVETSAKQIFDRFVGAALYRGWKQHLFAQDADAQIYYDEMRYGLAQRFIVVEPSLLAQAGLDWAYGATPKPPAQARPSAHVKASIAIDNHTIDSVVSGRTGKTAQASWQQALAYRMEQTPVQLRFTDTIQQWGGAAQPQQAGIAIDLLALRHNDGSLNIDRLKHAVRLAVVMLDLQDNDGAAWQPVSYCNMAALLMGLAIAYDSNEARATAAAISAIVTAETYATLAELARLRGKSPAYVANVDPILRALRNHVRAAYGDHADYERTSILPTPLELKAGADLALIAEAQRSWDKALEAVRKYGLRQIDATAFGVSPALAYFTEAATQDIAALPSLVALRSEDGETWQRFLAAPAAEALKRLDDNQDTTQSLTAYAVGSLSLRHAPAIDHARLRKLKFDDRAIARVEAYLPYVDKIQLAFTPWIVGEDFCIDVLKIDAARFDQPHFSLLHVLGFSDADIALANRFCYGRDDFAGAPELDSRHRPVFATQGQLSAEAHIRMAAAVQSFISGDVAAQITLSSRLPVEKIEKIFLEAWRQGLKSITIRFDDQRAVETTAASLQTTASKNTAAFLHSRKPHTLPQRKIRAKAQEQLVSSKISSRKNHLKSKH